MSLFIKYGQKMPVFTSASSVFNPFSGSLPTSCILSSETAIHKNAKQSHTLKTTLFQHFLKSQIQFFSVDGHGINAQRSQKESGMSHLPRSPAILNPYDVCRNIEMINTKAHEVLNLLISILADCDFSHFLSCKISFFFYKLIFSFFDCAVYSDSIDSFNNVIFLSLKLKFY